MQEVRSERLRQKAFLPVVALACFALFAFGTLAKTIQYWPDLNEKLQISNSCKIERHPIEGLNCDLAEQADTPVPLIVVQEPQLWLVPTDSESVVTDPFEPQFFSRPPPLHL